MTAKPDNSPAFPDAVQAHLARVYADVEEAVRTVFASLPWGLEVKMANGETLVLKKFVEPRRNSETGRWEFGFDLANDNRHLEFFVRHTGGGGSPAPDLQKDISAMLAERTKTDDR